MPEKSLLKLRKKALEYLKKHPNSGIFGGPFPNRTCWTCNELHKHLKRLKTPFQCFECCNIYLEGKKLNHVKK